MSKKKQDKEELIKTHVLNLTEIREAEEKEIHLKNKKIPIIFSIIGVLLITVGLAYPKLTRFVKKDRVEVASNVYKNTLTCISNIDDKNNNLKIYTKTVYSFNNKKLIASDTSTAFSMLSGNDYTIINNLKDQYSSLYVNTDNSIIYTISIENNALYFNSIINNYSRFNVATYNPLINTINHTTVFNGQENLDYVKNAEEKLGNLCN